MTTLAWGKVLYIDDLITKASSRSKGYANGLLAYAQHYAEDISAIKSIWIQAIQACGP